MYLVRFVFHEKMSICTVPGAIAANSFPTCYPTTVKDLRRAPAKVSLPSIFSGQPLQEHRKIPQIMKRKSSSTKRLMQSIKQTATSCHIELNYFYVFNGRSS
jgi:hypothetical protein